DRRLVRAAGIGLADPVDPLVRLNLDEDMVPAQADQERLDVRDSDLRADRVLARRLSRGCCARRTDGQSTRHEEVTPFHAVTYLSSCWANRTSARSRGGARSYRGLRPSLRRPGPDRG